MLWKPPAFGTQAVESTTADGLNVVVTAHATSHTKGDYIALFGPTTQATQYLQFHMSGTASGGTRTDCLMDIAIGTASDTFETIIIPNLVCGWSGGDVSGRTFIFPMRVPSGMYIGARMQSLISADTIAVATCVTYVGRYDSAYYYSAADAYGIDTANSIGTSHTLGNGAGAFSTWANIGSTTSKAYRGIMVLPQGTMADTTMTAQGTILEVGYSSTTLASFQSQNTVNEVCIGTGPGPVIPFPVSIPESTQLQIRGNYSGATQESMDVAVYCFY